MFCYFSSTSFSPIEFLSTFLSKPESETDGSEPPQMLSSASRCNILTILHQHYTLPHKSAAPYVSQCMEITMGLNLDLSQRFPGDIPQEKNICLSQHLNLCLELLHSKEKYSENESTSPQIQLPHFFSSFEEFVLFSLL